MSGKRSFIIIGILIVVLTVFVYHFSTPDRPMHLAPVVGDGTERSLPAADSSVKAGDTSIKK